MVKIGRWAEAYTEPGNPFPDETDSFAAMPPESPMQILSYGLLSEMILPLIKVKRREKREQRKEFLIKKTLNVNLRRCFEELYRLSKLDPRNELIPNLKSYHMNNKKNMMKLVDDCEIPLIYLEETYQKQLQGPLKLEIGDWVECKGQYGVVTCIGLGRSDVFVKLVKQVNTSWHDGTYYNYPIFHRWERVREGGNPRSKEMSRWECKKIGHDTPEWIRLRSRMIVDYNKNCTKRTSIWNDKLLPIISQNLIDVRPAPEYDSIVGCCKQIWFTMGINFLDKEVWKSIKENKKDNSYIVRHHLSWCWGLLQWYAESPQVMLRYLRNIVLRDGILD